ncbi:Response regulator receiver domain-containing protein [Desulfopila aestuarii DSM 18488]|uniref:Response regulator receiver domain-containing protein n=2 Tax=Desulfopila aestuarii TaxID=231440 RepID=A0A1M7XZ83_9BACT|nr:Response regulator receiver domain-containing protein [Desulfopila aestuarii DSM 18488]
MTGVSILLVDDEKDYIETLGVRLHQRGIVTDCAFSGPDALLYLSKEKSIDVVLLDIAMPGQNGLTTLQQIKSQHPLVEVIMLTGQATVHSAVEAIKHGATDFLTKPCDFETLIATVEKAAARRHERQMKILDIRMQPYLTDIERKEQIRQVLEK